MYVNSDYLEYKYIVSVSDNYVILTDSHNVVASWDNPRTIDVVYQYFDPSYINFEATRTITTNTTFPEVNVSDDFWDRPDVSELIVAIFCIVLLLICIVNSITSFVHRGGIFHA